MRLRRLLVAPIVLGALLAAVAGCGTSAITKSRLEAQIGPTFRNMYLVQQRLLGQDDPRTTPDSGVAVCDKGGPSTADTGPGEDWVCVLHWPAPSGITEPLSYEVRVQPGGCYTAQGPAPEIGQQTMRAADGRSVPNPLYEFDSCLSID